MFTHRILLFGGSGQIGKALQNERIPAHWLLEAPSRSQCDLMHPGEIAKRIHDFMPDLVINAAALTNIEECEQNKVKATEINFHAVANIAAQCTTVDAPLIHLSTDYVFDGVDNGGAYTTEDAMNPLNVYGQSKMMGEEAVRHGLYWHLIARTSSVFSADGENILTRTLRQIDTQDEIQVIHDQIANPTSADAVAAALIIMAEAILAGKGNGFGTFHICGEPAVTRLQFVQAIMDAYAPFTARHPRLVPVSSRDMQNRVPRPPYSAMNSDKARDVYGIEPRAWHNDLVKAIGLYVEKKREKNVAIF